MTQTSGKSYSRTLAEFATQLKYEDIPSDVVARVKDHITDTVGCAVAGSAMDWTRKIASVAKRMGGPPEATIIGDGARMGVASAVLANAACGRALDIDDTHFRPWAHLSAFVVPTAFTVGEALGKGGKDVITAAIAGYELACRFGLALGMDKVFMHDPTVGSVENKPVQRVATVFAAALEAARLMELDVDNTVSALGFAGSLNLSLMQTHREKAQALPFNYGWGAHAGVVAAMTAEAGLKGPERIFEGDRGYFAALYASDPHDPPRLVENLGTAWESALGTIKFFPAGHGTHYFLNSLRTLRKAGLRAEDVGEINCYVPAIRAEFHFLPREKAYRPGAYDARFSLPYLLSVMLVDGNVGIRSFSEEKVRDPEILGLADKIVHTLDEESWRPENRGRIVVKTRDGRVLEQSTPHTHLPGTPEHPAPHQDIVDKFKDNASLVLSDSAVDKLLRALEKLEEVDDVGEIMRLTVP
ncbi:MAG: MmgE/PrpD family protein [Chloroflexi bacterium]|nr:MmgE/PrpD family protein [Chloroflexota bacterium]